MIAKRPPSFQFVIEVPFSNQIFFGLKKLNSIPIDRQNFASYCLAMAIAAALFIRARHVNNHWKIKEDVYKFGI
jgi:hypothetical protein